MNRVTVALISLIGIALWPSLAHGLTLVRDGEGRAVIIVAEDAPEVTRYAAGELQTYIEKMSGATLDIIRVNDEADAGVAQIPLTTNLILVGESAFTNKRGLSADSLKPDGFRIITKPRTLIILGKDSPVTEPDASPCKSCKGRLGDAGTLYGVYRLLEHLGVRWFFPGEIGEVVPQMTTVAVHDLSIADAPYFASRLCYGLDGDWLRRVGFGGTVFPGRTFHSFANWHDKYHESHPEWFALRDDGTRAKHLCWYGPGVREQMIRDVREFFSTHHDAQLWPDFTVMRCDGAPRVCQCPQCQKRVGPDGSLSDYITEAAVEIAAAIKDEFPDRRIVIGAYEYDHKPPVKVGSLPANVSVHLAKFCWTYWPEEVGEEFYSTYLTGWLSKQPATMAFWDYYDMDVGSVRAQRLGIPALATGLIAKDMKVVKQATEDSDIPFLGEVIFAGPASLTAKVLSDRSTRRWWLCPNVYITGKLLWNPDLSVESLRQDFYDNYFGPAKEPMKKFYTLAEERWLVADEHKRAADELWNVAFSPAVFREMAGYFLQAKRLSTASPYKERLAMIQEGFEFTLARSQEKTGVKTTLQ